jgi:hypothetical protein
MPNEIRDKVELRVGCIAGALEDHDYEAKLERAGVKDIELEPTRVYEAAQARDLLRSIGPDADRVAAATDGKFASAFIRARKPAAL